MPPKHKLRKGAHKLKKKPPHRILQRTHLANVTIRKQRFEAKVASRYQAQQQSTEIASESLIQQQPTQSQPVPAKKTMDSRQDTEFYAPSHRKNNNPPVNYILI